MANDKSVTELDLLAYADGLLDHDPRHKAVVEAALGADPALRVRADAFRAQTQALHAAYDRRLAEPVPERLTAVIEDRPRRIPSMALRAAALVLLALTAGMAGWMLGQGDERLGGLPPAAGQLADRAYAQYLAERPGGSGPAVAAVADPVQPLGWLADELSIRVKAPDLSSSGYRIVDRQLVAANGGRIVRLDYAAEDGPSFSLFIAPRWDPERQALAELTRGGVSIVSWLDGPLTAAVVTRAPRQEARGVAETVRERMRASDEPPAAPRVAPAMHTIGEAAAIANTVPPPAAHAPQASPSPSPAAVQPN